MENQMTLRQNGFILMLLSGVEDKEKVNKILANIKFFDKVTASELIKCLLDKEVDKAVGIEPLVA